MHEKIIEVPNHWTYWLQSCRSHVCGHEVLHLHFIVYSLLVCYLFLLPYLYICLLFFSPIDIFIISHKKILTENKWVNEYKDGLLQRDHHILRNSALQWHRNIIIEKKKRTTWVWSTALGDDCIHHLILLFNPLLEITNTEDVWLLFSSSI